MSVEKDRNRLRAKVDDSGYEIYWGGNMQTKMLLPARVIEALTVESVQRKAEAETAKAAPESVEVNEIFADSKEKSAEGRTSRSWMAPGTKVTFPDDPALIDVDSDDDDGPVVFFHHAIHNLTEIRVKLASLPEKSTDTAEALRVSALRDVVDLGESRVVEFNPKWHENLMGLAQEFPSFLAVIEQVIQAYRVAEVTKKPPRIRPILLVGDPGLGKSFFCQRLIDALRVRSKWIALDSPTAGGQLRGSDKHWSTSSPGALLELIGREGCVNPLLVIDELDKASRSLGSNGIDVLGQLYSCLEPQTSQRISDLCTDVEMDASLVTYIATANSLSNIDPALLSRFEVFHIELPHPDDRRKAAQRIIKNVIEKMGLDTKLKASAGCSVVLENYSPRIIARTVEKSAGAAIARGRNLIQADDIERALGLPVGDAEPKKQTRALH